MGGGRPVGVSAKRFAVLPAHLREEGLLALTPRRTYHAAAPLQKEVNAAGSGDASQARWRTAWRWVTRGRGAALGCRRRGSRGADRRHRGMPLRRCHAHLYPDSSHILVNLTASKEVSRTSIPRLEPHPGEPDCIGETIMPNNHLPENETHWKDVKNWVEYEPDPAYPHAPPRLSKISKILSTPCASTGGCTRCCTCKVSRGRS